MTDDWLVRPAATLAEWERRRRHRKAVRADLGTGPCGRTESTATAQDPRLDEGEDMSAPTELPPTNLQIPVHHQTLDHRYTNTADAPVEVGLRLHAMRIALDSVAVAKKDRYFDDQNRPTPAQLLDEAFAQADRVMDYYQSGQWERTPEPVAAVAS